MKKILLTVFIVIVTLVTSVGVYYVSSPARAQELLYTSIKSSIKTNNAYIVREEEVYYADASGTLYNNIENGERVAANSVLTTIYHSDISANTLKTLKTIDKKISKAQDKNKKLSAYSIDYSDAESTVAAIIKEIPQAAKDNNIRDIAEFKDLINSLRGSSEISHNDELNSLYTQKEEIENKINSSKSEVSTSISGVFTTYIDSLESVLRADDITSYTPSYIDALPKAKNQRLTDSVVAKNSPVGKVQNNHVWYMLFSTDTSALPELLKGQNLSIKFDAIKSGEIDATIHYISEDENGKTLVAAKCTSYVEGAFSYRTSSAELIFRENSGYKVPIYAIRTDDNGNKYVLCRRGANEYRCYCTIDYTNPEDEYILINSTKDAQHKLQDMKQVVIGEK